MSYIYFPRTHRFRAFNKEKRFHFARLYEYRKYSLIELTKIINCVLLFVFLLIAFRLGSIFLLSFSNLGGFLAASYSDGIHIPKVENYNRHRGSIRHFIYISIHENGIVKIDGSEIDKNLWSDYLYTERIHDPQIVACLLVDRDCTMDLVKEVLFKLQKPLSVFTVIGVHPDSGLTGSLISRLILDSLGHGHRLLAVNTPLTYRLTIFAPLSELFCPV